MLLIAGNDEQYCPYRDCLGIDTSTGRISWYQLLAVAQNATTDELKHRHEQRRTLVIHNRKETRNPVWDDVLDELDQAFVCLTHPVLKADYDEDLARRSRQTSLIRAVQSNEQIPMGCNNSDRANASQRNSKATTGASARTRFEPLRLIGRGHQGTKVFEAYEFTLGRTVAVKCLEKAARTVPRCQAFVEEAKFLASISHPNLVEVHSVNERSNCFVMEMLGVTVQQHFRANKSGICAPEQVAEFLAQGLAVLQCIHERGVVHGGIGLKSFLAAESGTIKLVDAPGCTRAGIYRSPAPDQICIAPELLSPDTFGEAKAGVDLYMLGFAAVQLLAGVQLPKWFRKVTSTGDPDQQQWLRWHSSPLEKVPALEELVPEIPMPLANVIEKLCQKQVVDRYRSAAEAIADLAPLRSTSESTAARPSRRPSNDGNAMPAVENRGGDAPCVENAKMDMDQAPDLLTMLQDPHLAWTAIRQHKGAQAMFAVLVAMIVAVLFWPQSQRTIPPQELAKTASTPPFPPKHETSPSAEPPPIKILDVPIVVGPGTTMIYPDLEPIPVVMPIRPINQPTSSPSMLISQQQPFARRFGVAGVSDAEKAEQFKSLLWELRSALASDERRRLLEAARKIAPKDPRPLFIFSATYEFGSAAKDELRESVRLSGADYTQPFRNSVESILRGPMRKELIADQVLAELIRFRDQMNPEEFRSEDAYDWEWIGRVLGYMERSSTEVNSFRTILTRHAPRISDGNHSDAADCIERGRMWVIRHQGNDLTADTVFPPSPMIEIDLCLKTLETTNEKESYPQWPASGGTAVAKGQNVTQD